MLRKYKPIIGTAKKIWFQGSADGAASQFLQVIEERHASRLGLDRRMVELWERGAQR